jgi:hypothetical protein
VEATHRRASTVVPGAYRVAVLSTFAPHSVVALATSAAPAELAARFQRLTSQHFPGAATYTLLRQVSPALRLLMLAARRRPAPHNVLLRADLTEPLDDERRDALEVFRAGAAAVAGELLLFHTSNTQFHERGSGPDDVAMAFINTWPADRSRQDAQRYWIDRHGPLVRRTGLPPVVTSYSQIHFDGTLDSTYQGLSFETITSQRDLVSTYLRDASLRRLNRTLLDDERHFTGPPLFFAFGRQPVIRPTPA